MRYLLAFFVFVFFPSQASAQDAMQFNADRPVIYKKEIATLSWNAAGASACSSYVDVLDSHGKWVWQFSDKWQSDSRAAQGTFQAKPADDARYYLDCTIEGQKISKYVEVQVIDRDKYISGEETPNAPVVSSKPAVAQEKKMVAENQQPVSNTKKEETAAVQSSGGSSSSNGNGSNFSTPAVSGEDKANATSTQQNNKDDKDLIENEVLSKKTEAKRLEDSDSDLLLDVDEVRLGTDPNNPDTDGDGYPDGLEVKNGYSPLVKASKKSGIVIPVQTGIQHKRMQKLNNNNEAEKFLINSKGKKVSSQKKSVVPKTKMLPKKQKKVLNTKKKTSPKTPKKVDKKVKRK